MMMKKKPITTIDHKKNTYIGVGGGDCGRRGGEGRPHPQWRGRGKEVTAVTEGKEEEESCGAAGKEVTAEEEERNSV